MRPKLVACPRGADAGAHDSAPLGPQAEERPRARVVSSGDAQQKPERGDAEQEEQQHQSASESDGHSHRFAIGFRHKAGITTARLTRGHRRRRRRVGRGSVGGGSTGRVESAGGCAGGVGGTDGSARARKGSRNAPDELITSTPKQARFSWHRPSFFFSREGEQKTFGAENLKNQ